MPKRILNGKIVSNKSNKTVVVEISRKVKHKLYKKMVKKNKKFHAHIEDNNFNIGDNVSIEETKPISKLKRWKVISDLNEGDNNDTDAV